MGKLLLLFTVVPFVELYLLMWVADHVGFWATVGLVLFTGALGAAMARVEGLRVMRSWQAALQAGRMPEDGVISGVLVLVGGVLLVTPGVLTDLLGFSLLFPPTRRLVAAVLAARLERAVARGSIQVVQRGGMVGMHGTGGGPFVRVDQRPSRRPSAHQEIIDVEAEVVD